MILVEGMIRMMQGADDFTGPVNIANSTIREPAEKGIMRDRWPIKFMGGPG